MLWERRWLIVGLVILTTGLSLVARPPAPTTDFSATLTLQVRSLTFSPTGVPQQSSLRGVAPEEIQAARSPDAASATAKALGQKDGGLGILNRLSVTGVQQTDLMQLTLIGKGSRTSNELTKYAQTYVALRIARDQARLDAARADNDALIARAQAVINQLARNPESRVNNALLAAWEEQLRGLVRQAAEIDLLGRPGLTGDRIKIIGSPLIQQLGALPTRTIRTVAGPLVGVLLGCAIAIAMGILRPRLASRERAEERLGYPVLAAIPHVPSASGRDPLKIQRGSAWGAEGVRMLLTEIGLVEKRGRRVRVIVVASPDPREGRTTISVNLAASFAAAGRSVALFHADRERPTPPGHRTAEFVGQHDITEVRMHKDGFAEVLPGPDRPETLGGTKRSGLGDIVQDLAADFDVVIVDTRPVLLSADAVALASQGDVVLMVVRHLKTMEARAASALEILERHDAAIAGVVFNDHRIGKIERFRSGRVERPRTRAIVPAPQRVRPEPVVASERLDEGPVEARLARRRTDSGILPGPVREQPARVEPGPSREEELARQRELFGEPSAEREAAPAGAVPGPEDRTGT